MAERLKRPAGPGEVEASPPAEPAGVAKSPAEMLRAGGEQAVGEAKAIAIDVAEKQRARAVDALGGVARALHRTAKDLDAENNAMARYTDLAAEKLDQAARYLRQARMGDIVLEAERLARRQPWWFLGGAVATGFIAARLLKNTGTAAESEIGPQSLPGSPSMAAASGAHPPIPGEMP